MQSSEWTKIQISNYTIKDILSKYRNDMDIVMKKNICLNNQKFMKVYKKWTLKHLFVVLVLD